jgi:serine/threonine protein phosphatase 1
MNGVTYEFSKVILLGQNLMETALSLDQRIKPNDLLYPKRLTLYDEIYIGHTPVTHWRNRTCTKSLYLEYRYRSGFKGPLHIDVTKRVLAERAQSLCILTKKEEIKI